MNIQFRIQIKVPPSLFMALELTIYKCVWCDSVKEIKGFILNALELKHR